jgi:uncharacterized membrane protein
MHNARVYYANSSCRCFNNYCCYEAIVVMIIAIAVMLRVIVVVLMPFAVIIRALVVIIRAILIKILPYYSVSLFNKMFQSTENSFR